MVFSKREQLLGIGVGAAVALLGLNYFVLDPYLQRQARIEADRRDVDAERDRIDTLLLRRDRKQQVWARMTAGGLKSDPSEADSQVLHALREWAQESGLTVASTKRSSVSQERQFAQISVNQTCTGTMSAVAKFLWCLETASIPLRVNEVQLTPRKEGTDDLQLQINVSTLSLIPDADKPDNRPGGGGGGNERSRALTSAADARGDR